MPQSSKRRLILAKLEATYGVDPTPDASNAMLISDLDVSPMEAETVERDLIRPYYGQAERLMASIFAKASFNIELGNHSSGLGLAPKIDCLLQACALAGESVEDTSYIYKPISDAIKSITLYYFQDGVLHKITGAKGTLSIDIKVKEIPKLKFEFTGLSSPVVDSAMVNATFANFKVPQVANTQNTTGFSLLGYGAALESLSIALNNTVNYTALIGKEYVEVLDRKASGSMTFEAPLMAEKNFFAAAKDQASGVMTITHGSVSGNKVKIDFPKVLLDSPKYSVTNNVMMLTCGVSAMPDEGNDEVQLTFL